VCEPAPRVHDVTQQGGPVVRTKPTSRVISACLLAIVLPCSAQTPSGTDPASGPAGAPVPSPPVLTDFSQSMAMMMAPALAMMNPYLYHQWSQFLVNPLIDSMTKHRVLEAMMAAFDPAILVGAHAAAGNGGTPRVPRLQIPGFPTQTEQTWRPNTVTTGVSSEAKRKFYQAAMMMSPLSMRDMIGIMADKRLVDEDVSFDDAVDAMKLRANEVNFKLVGHNQVWLDVRAISGDEDTPRFEIFQFCDAMVGRKVLDYVPEFVVFLPCRIALLEDADDRLWVMTLDWDVGWLDYVQNPNSVLDAELRTAATRIRDAMQYIMEGAATGDF